MTEHNQKLLQILMTADERSDEYQQALAALEGNAALLDSVKTIDTQNLSDDQFVALRQSLLEEQLPAARDRANSGTVVVEIDRVLDGDDYEESLDYEPISLDFLQKASHPELLGRLDRYDIERVVGNGGMGVVLKAYDTELHRVVAIKVLAPHLAHRFTARRRFAREAQAAAAVVHPHVIPIHNVESDGDLPYLVMQYVAGESLQQRVDRLGLLTIAETLRIAQQTAAGLAAAHAQGLVHRDVKPANILLEDQVERVLLSDFGLARTVDDASLTRTGVVTGTPWYMSPEQALGEAVDSRSDLFSLGCVICFMLTGESPFRARNAMAVLNRICHEPHLDVCTRRSDVPAELWNLVNHLLAKKPDDRFSAAAQLEVELGRLLAAHQQGKLKVLRKPLHSGISKLLTQMEKLTLFQALELFGVLCVVVMFCLYGGMRFRQWLDGTADPAMTDSQTASSQLAGGDVQGSNALKGAIQPQPTEQTPSEQTREPSLTVQELRILVQQHAEFIAEGLQLDQEIDDLRRQLEAVTPNVAAPDMAVPDMQVEQQDPFQQGAEELLRAMRQFQEQDLNRSIDDEN